LGRAFVARASDSKRSQRCRQDDRRNCLRRHCQALENDRAPPPRHRQPAIAGGPAGAAQGDRRSIAGSRDRHADVLERGESTFSAKWSLGRPSLRRTGVGVKPRASGPELGYKLHGLMTAAFTVRVLLSDLARRGIPTSTALSGTALEGLDFSTEARIDDELFDDLLERAASLAGDPAFGLTWARDVNPADWGLLYQLSAVAPTFAEAMAGIVQLRGNSDQNTFALQELPDLFVVKFLVRARTATGLRAKSEFGMRLIWEMFCGFVGPDARAHRVGFAYPAPAYRSEYDRAFRSAVAFGQDATVLEVPMVLAQRRQPHEDAVLRNILQVRAQVRRVITETPWASRVSTYLDAVSPELLPDIAETARHFGMSERNLRRRLVAEGRSFSSLADEIRARTGIRWLTESEAPIKEIAHKLGFSRASAFERAFKRWTGSTPAACRATHTAGGGEARRPAR
jgi:AraC-like DNA-binding protein